MTRQAQISLMDLFKLGSHRGNHRSKLNPKLKARVYGSKDGLSLIDLAKLQESSTKVEELLTNLGKNRKQVLIVGTESHLQALTKKAAAKMGRGMPFVNQRWLGGTLTNWATVKKTLKTLEKNQKIIENEKFFKDLSRNEQLSLTRETEKLQNIFGGLMDLKSNRPGALLVLDAARNYTAIQEADTMNIPVIALANTATLILSKNTDYTVVCNNNSTKLISMLMNRFVEAYNEGLNQQLESSTKDTTVKN